MDEKTIELLQEREARLTPEIQRAVRRRAGGRCEGWIDDGRMKYSERCTARGGAVNFWISFWAEMADDPFTDADVHLLCEECYENSETAEQWRHFDHMLSKDD